MDNIQLPAEYKTDIKPTDDGTIAINQEMEGHLQSVELSPARAIIVANALLEWAKDKVPKDMKAYNRERQAACRARRKTAQEGAEQ